MEKEEFLKNRIRDLAVSADRRGCVTFTDFLNLNEQNIFMQTLQKFSRIRGETFGGYEGSERRVGALIPEEVLCVTQNEDQAVSPLGIVYPICCVHILPRSQKFAEKFSHRDVLGALMNLGLDRAKLGDIAVTETETFLFCADSLSDLICRELTRIRHTPVNCLPCAWSEVSYVPATLRVKGSIASVRLDAVLALGFHASRSSLLPLIENGSVFVNGRLVTSNGYALKENDVISVRGKGKLKYIGTEGQTKKGRILAAVDRYV